MRQLSKNFPGLLPRNRMGPFIDPDWDNRDDPVPVWTTMVHLMFMVWTIIANAPNPAGVSILKKIFQR